MKAPPPATSLFAGDREIASLDGWRAAAIAIVFLGHAGLGHIVPGGLGVSLFFFLSGFLITTLLLREYGRHGRIDIRAFYLRRTLRIAPPMIIVALLAYLLVAAGVLQGGATLAGALAQIFYFANYYTLYFDPGQTTPAGTGVYWSLTVEEHFYLLFPGLLLGLLHAGEKRRLAGWLGAACAAVLLWRITLVSGFGASPERIYYATDTRLDAILFGCTLAAWCWAPARRLRPPPAPGRGALALLLASGGLLLFSLLHRDPWFRETWRYSLQGIAFAPLFLYSVHHPGWGLFRLLNLAWVKRLGVYSYVIYLVHHIALENLRALPLPGPLPPALASALAALALSLLIAWAMHRHVELPLRALRARHLPPRSPASALPPAAGAAQPSLQPPPER